MKRGIVYTAVIVLVIALATMSFVLKDKLAEPEAEPEVISRVEPVSTPAPTPEPVGIPIDFKHWKEINEDVYAWINMPGTNIDYPVLQSNENEDSDYYLEYNIDHTKGRPGCIYSEKEYNTKTFKDDVTVLYGHDMWTDNTYFHQLHLLEDQEFFDNNKEIIIYTPDRVLKYTIFGVVNFDDRHLMANYYGFTMVQDKMDFLNDCLAFTNSIYDMDGMKAAAEESSHILILSTCNRIAEDQRYLVLAMLTEEEMGG